MRMYMVVVARNVQESTFTSHALECVLVMWSDCRSHRTFSRSYWEGHTRSPAVSACTSRKDAQPAAASQHEGSIARHILLRILRNRGHNHQVRGWTNCGMTVFDSLARPGRCNMQAGGAAKHNTTLQIAANPCERREVRGCS